MSLVDADKFSGHLIECRVTTSVCVTVIICRGIDFPAYVVLTHSMECTFFPHA